ncbi:hypothetical protein [Micromonospora zamorensis]|uniref:hypothetical protein n=1 Tax=Micromonospora zamorensis TaxID=709883 RepID=UPI0037A05E33
MSTPSTPGSALEEPDRALVLALSQASRVAAERVALTALIARGDRVDVPGLFGRLTAAHTARMAAAGLNN